MGCDGVETSKSRTNSVHCEEGMHFGLLSISHWSGGWSSLAHCEECRDGVGDLSRGLAN